MGDKKEHHKHHKQDPNRPQSQDVADLEEISEEEFLRLGGQSQKQRQPTKHDINGRILRREINKDESTTILIGVGSEQGVEDGMQGKLVAGNVHIPFRVYNTQDRTCLAKINVPNQDIIIQNPYVIINPSKH